MPLPKSKGGHGTPKRDMPTHTGSFLSATIRPP